MLYAPTPADFDTLVALARARGIDPMSVALLLFEESAFDPTRVNFGSGDAGLNQMDPENLRAAGLTRAQWIAMEAAEQLPHVFKFWDGLTRTFAGGVFPPTGAALLGLNFLPGRYKLRGAGANRDAPLTAKGDVDGHRKDGTPFSFYDDNASLDPRGTGAISVNTIDARLSDVAKQGGARWTMIGTGVQGAIVRAGGGTPSTPPAPPVGPGALFGGPGAKAGLTALLLAILAAAYAAGRG